MFNTKRNKCSNKLNTKNDEMEEFSRFEPFEVRFLFHKIYIQLYYICGYKVSIYSIYVKSNYSQNKIF